MVEARTGTRGMDKGKFKWHSLGIDGLSFGLSTAEGEECPRSRPLETRVFPRRTGPLDLIHFIREECTSIFFGLVLIRKP